MPDLVDDLRYAWRQLRRTPSFTAIAVITLALGIAANTTFFAINDAVVWRPLGAANLEQVYELTLYRAPRALAPGERRPDGPSWTALSEPQLAHLQAIPALGILASTSVGTRGVVAQTPTADERLSMELVRGDYAGVYGLQPVAGQLIGLEHDELTAGPRVVITERLWRGWYKGDAAVIGAAEIRLDGRTFTIAGVLPARASSRMTDIWIAADSWHQPGDPSPASAVLTASFVRLRPGVSPSRLAPMLDASLTTGPAPPAAEFKAVMNAADRTGLSRAGAIRATWLIVGLSALVLLAACANLANMLYARASQRTGEIAVRVALGARAGRIFGLFFFEATIIAGLAATAGAGLAMLVLRAIKTVPGVTMNRYTRTTIDVPLDWRVIAYAIALGFISALAVGLLTAWRGSRTPPLRLFGASGIAANATTRGKWTRTALVAIQVSAAVILLLGTGLYLIEALKNMPPSVRFDGSKLATAQIDFDSGQFNDSQVTDTLPKVLASLERIDQIDSVAITDGLFGGAYSRPKGLQNLVAEDEAQPGKLSGWRLLTGSQAAVSPRFLETLGLALLSGRNFTANDDASTPEVVMLSQSAVQSLWPGLTPLGKRVRLAGDRRWFTVIGTFEDPLKNRDDTPWLCAACVALTPWAQMRDREWLIVVRAAAPDAVAARIRPAVHLVDDRIPVFRASAANSSILVTTNAQAAFGGLMGALGVLSMAIAALGVYGVISYTVSRRTREFGIRLALGATPRQIVRAVLDEALHLVLVGLLPGVLLASWATRVLEVAVVRMMPNDIPTWAAVPVLVLVIGVFAAWIPARRAGRVDPNVALRDL